MSYYPQPYERVAAALASEPPYRYTRVVAAYAAALAAVNSGAADCDWAKINRAVSESYQLDRVKKNAWKKLHSLVQGERMPRKMVCARSNEEIKAQFEREARDE